MVPIEASDTNDLCLNTRLDTSKESDELVLAEQNASLE